MVIMATKPFLNYLKKILNVQFIIVSALTLLYKVDSEQAPPRIQTSNSISVATAVCPIHLPSYPTVAYLTPSDIPSNK